MSGRGGGGSGSGGGGGGGRPRGGRGRGRGGGPKSKQQQGEKSAGGKAPSSNDNEKGGGGGGGGRKGQRGGGGGGRDGGRGRGKGGRNKNEKKGEKAAANNNNASSNSKPSPKDEKIQQKPSAEEIKLKEEARRLEEEAAAEQKRKEEEAKLAEEAARERKKKEEELAQTGKEMKEVLKGFLEVAERHKVCRTALEPEALAKSRKDFQSNKKSLKTDLKKCTAFVKKVKSGSVWSTKCDDIRKDISTLNLSRYVEEVAAAVLEGKPKPADTPTVVTLCAEMHQKYDNFLPTLLPAMWEVVQKAKADPESTKSRRLYVRLLTDFLLSGLLTELKPLLKCVAEATGANSKDDSYTVQDGNLVVAFCRTAGFEVFGVIPKSVQEAAAWFQNQNESLLSSSIAEEGDGDNKTASSSLPALPPTELVKDGMALKLQVDQYSKVRAVEPEVSEILTKHCIGAYNFMATSLVQTHGKLQKLEKRCEQDRLLSGSLTDAREQGLADARKLKENLQKSVDVMSDVLDQPVPFLQEDEDDGDRAGGLGVEVWTKSGNEENDFGPFDDEETRAFYCDIPDLLATIPPALLAMTPEQIEKKKEENAKKYGKDFEAVADTGEDSPEVAPVSEAELEEKENAAKLEDAALEEAEEGAEGDRDAPRFKLMVLLEEELPECHRREQIDEVTEKFCTNHGSSKNSRKRLSRTLFLVPRNRFDLLPYYSRMAATVDRLFSDVAKPLVTELEQQFHGQAKFKKNQNLDGRLKTARYIGELTKFRVAPPIIFLRCLRRCLDDFTGGNVDVACCLLESCGRFLYRLKHTSKRVADLMETMTRLSKAKV